MSWLDQGDGWNHVPQPIRETAEKVCTAKELEVVKMKAAGYSDRRMSDILKVSRWSVRDRARNAVRKITEATEEAA